MTEQELMSTVAKHLEAQYETYCVEAWREGNGAMSFEDWLRAFPTGQPTKSKVVHVFGVDVAADLVEQLAREKANLALARQLINRLRRDYMNENHLADQLKAINEEKDLIIEKLDREVERWKTSARTMAGQLNGGMTVQTWIAGSQIGRGDAVYADAGPSPEVQALSKQLRILEEQQAEKNAFTKDLLAKNGALEERLKQAEDRDQRRLSTIEHLAKERDSLRQLVGSFKQALENLYASIHL